MVLQSSASAPFPSAFSSPPSPRYTSAACRLVGSMLTTVSAPPPPPPTPTPVPPPASARARRRVEAGDGVRLARLVAIGKPILPRPRNAIRRDSACRLGNATPHQEAWHSHASQHSHTAVPRCARRGLRAPLLAACEPWPPRSRRRTRDRAHGGGRARVAVADVAILFSGCLAAIRPARARASLVDPLGADVIVAARSGLGCLNKRHARGQCLLLRLRGLEPISKLGLSPMLRMRELRAHAEASPSFARGSRDFNAREPFNGVTIVAPVRGNHNVSVLRELSDYSRSLALCEEHARARGRQYERLVFSRLEFVGLAPHPPLALMPAREALPPHRPIVWAERPE